MAQIILPANVAGADPAERRTKRFRLWELQECWYCMIIGTCLTLREVRQMARKAGFKVDQMSDYETHRLAVERASNSTHQLTQRLQKLLDRKFDVQIKRFRRAGNEAELGTLWRGTREAGEIGGGLWALLTHPRVTAAVIHEVFGEIHMMSHLAGAKSCIDLHRLSTQELRIEELEEALAAARRKHHDTTRTLANQVHTLEQSLRYSQSELAHERARSSFALAQVETTTTDASTLQSQPVIDRLRRKHASTRRQLKSVEADRQRLAQDNARLDRLLTHALVRSGSQEKTTEGELCGRCVLYLGGKAQQCRHFQALVEAQRGRFLHHDGGIEDNGQRIAELIHQADAVLCPTDCISHSAMKKARLLCEKQDKPIVFMPRASLSTFASSIEQLCVPAS